MYVYFKFTKKDVIKIHKPTTHNTAHNTKDTQTHNHHTFEHPHNCKHFNSHTSHTLKQRESGVPLAHTIQMYDAHLCITLLKQVLSTWILCSTTKRNQNNNDYILILIN